MKQSLLNLASTVALLTVIAIAFVVIPETARTPTVQISVALFALASAFPFRIPRYIATRESRNGALRLASVSPICLLAAGLFLVTLGAVAAALVTHDTLALALDILAIGGFAIGRLVLQSALHAVSAIADMPIPGSNLRWQMELEALLAAYGDVPETQPLWKVLESLRYAPGDTLGGTPHDQEIDTTITTLRKVAGENPSELGESMEKLKVLLSQRDIFLRAARRKA